MGFARNLKLSYSLHTPMLEANIYWFPVWQALLEAQKKKKNTAMKNSSYSYQIPHI